MEILNDGIVDYVALFYDFANNSEAILAHQEIIKRIQQTDQLVFFTHPNPDEDAIGSSIALACLAYEINPQIRLQLNLPSPANFEYDFLKKSLNFPLIIKEGEEKIRGEAFSCPIVLLDIGSITRLQPLSDILEVGPIINIDHHPQSPNKQLDNLEVNFVDPNFQSTSEMIFWLTLKTDVCFNPPMASAILLGIFGDTEYYQSPYLPPRIDILKHFLKKQGADEESIIKDTIRAQKKEIFQILPEVLKLTRFKDGVAYIVIPYELYRKYTQNGSISFPKAYLARLIRNIKDLDYAFVIVETEPGKLDCSLRARTNNCNLKNIAEKFGGGGHPQSASFKIDGDIWEVVELLLS